MSRRIIWSSSCRHSTGIVVKRTPSLYLIFQVRILYSLARVSLIPDLSLEFVPCTPVTLLRLSAGTWLFLFVLVSSSQVEHLFWGGVLGALRSFQGKKRQIVWWLGRGGESSFNVVRWRWELADSLDSSLATLWWSNTTLPFDFRFTAGGASRWTSVRWHY